MPTDPTEYPPPLEPTQAAYSNPYEPTSLYPGSVPPIPPPPPASTRRKWWHIAVPIVMVVALVVLSVLPNVMTSGQRPTNHFDPGGTAAAQTGATERAAETATASAPTAVPIRISTPTPLATPTINTSYTASDILTHLQAVDNTIALESTNETIWNWTLGDYYINVYATSSVQFTGCPIGTCADTWHFGLWVYASAQDAQSAYEQVYNDSLTCTDTRSHADGMYVSCSYPEQEYTQGRCLLLNAVQQSVYGQVITQYCV
jgi:hypothetical protein